MQLFMKKCLKHVIIIVDLYIMRALLYSVNSNMNLLNPDWLNATLELLNICQSCRQHNLNWQQPQRPLVLESRSGRMWLQTRAEINIPTVSRLSIFLAEPAADSTPASGWLVMLGYRGYSGRGVGGAVWSIGRETTSSLALHFSFHSIRLVQ